MKMTPEILNVIHAVLDYKRFVLSHMYVVDNIYPLDNFDWYEKVEDYYHSLPLPEGMHKNKEDFEKILRYRYSSKKVRELNEMDKTYRSEFGKFEW